MRTRTDRCRFRPSLADGLQALQRRILPDATVVNFISPTDTTTATPDYSYSVTYSGGTTPDQSGAPVAPTCSTPTMDTGPSSTPTASTPTMTS